MRLRMERNGDCMVVIEWQPEGRRKLGRRLKITWRRYHGNDLGMIKKHTMSHDHLVIR